MTNLKHVAVLSSFALLSSICALAADNNKHSVDFPESLQIGSTELKAGSYKVEWQGPGPTVQVSFLQNGNTVITVPATLQTNDKQVTQDDVVTDTTSANRKALEEIDFDHQKEALVFAQPAR
jgi:virulence-associated protein VagC